MPAGQSERVDFLRARIAALEASEGPRGAVRIGATPWGGDGVQDPSQGLSITFGEHPDPCSLDQALRAGLPRGALHEVVAARPHDRAAATGFALTLAARFAQMKAKGKAQAQVHSKIIWIIETKARRETGGLYGSALRFYGFDPGDLILVETRDAQESLWAMEEALKCSAPAAVIGEIWGLAKIYDLAASRRLVLAARKGMTPGLLVAAGLAGAADHLSSGAGTRFEVAAKASLRLPSAASRLPLPGKTVWAVRLVKARAGPLGFGFDRDKLHRLFWDPEKACFRDALPLGFFALSGDRQARPAQCFQRA
jgi:protein ImuA